ncbi:MAG: GTPase Era, partial [Halobacteriovoraceae bacterium]|nr:GTPase Era [Halobacteriovoraceae bacterium]
MLLKNQNPFNKSVMCSVLGSSNVGKSSLINYLLGEDLSVVTDKVQTTRNRYHCVFTVDHTEIILLDTPGFFTEKKEMDKRMNQQAKEAYLAGGVNLLLIDASTPIMPQITNFLGQVNKKEGLVWVVFTKVDLLENTSKLPWNETMAEIKRVAPLVQRHFLVSSKTGEGMHLLIGAICDAAISGPHLYPNGRISNRPWRFFAAEYIREQAFYFLHQELPYHLTVLIDEFKDYEQKKYKIDSRISATILVNRPSQRAIVVGKKGEMIKKIGVAARKRIEEMMQGRIHLNLHVKVSPLWF